MAAVNLKQSQSGDGSHRDISLFAADGGYILMIGPPGTGKSMRAARIPGILPLLWREESLETARTYSVTLQE